ncbi:MAG: peptidoglycan DD-metalloendopeptidase family protein [Candidatus Hydrogenedentes bacterium]|nr:peptidoglycan DD-metalloendopeptidase family protein [Candidatus Hydrogenedentota bacterium]
MQIILPLELAAKLPPTVSSATYTRLTPRHSPWFQEQLSKVASNTSVPAGYTVQKGDTLSHIVQQRLRQAGGQPTAKAIYEGVQKVARHNALRDPDLIFPGDRLDLGVLASSTVAQAPAMAALPISEIPKVLAASPEIMNLPLIPAMPLLSASPEASTLAEGGPVLKLPERGSMRSLFDRVAEEAREKKAGLTGFIQTVLHPKRSQSPDPPAGLPSRESPWKRTLDGPARLTSEFGRRKDPFSGELAFHEGIDLATKSGTKIYPFQAGVVAFSGWKSGYGNVVIVRHEDGAETIYGHNSSNLIQTGEQVDERTALAEAGSTGRSTGPHLHFEVRKQGKAVNPLPYLTGEASL